MGCCFSLVSLFRSMFKSISNLACISATVLHKYFFEKNINAF